MEHGIIFGYYWGALWTFAQLMYFPLGMLVVWAMLRNRNERKIALLVLSTVIVLIVSKVPIWMMIGLKSISPQQYSEYGNLTGILWMSGMLGVLVSMIMIVLKINTRAEQVGGADSAR